MAVEYFILCFLLSGVLGNGSKDHTSTRSGFDQQLYEDVLDAALCDEQLIYLWNNTLGQRFLDASAKIPSGILTGNVNDLGDYFQCLRIHQTVDDMEFQGKYCTIVAPLDQQPIIWPELPELPDLPDLDNVTWPDLNITWPEIPLDHETVLIADRQARLQYLARSLGGVNDPSYEPASSRIFPLAITANLGATLAVCIPKVCNATQAIEFVQSRVPFMNITYRENFCRLPKDKPFVAADYVAISIFSLIGLLTIISTTYDLLHLFIYKRDPKQANTLYRSFSIYTNTKRFLSFNSGPGALECIDGIRAISMAWVVVGHTHSMTLLGYLHNVLDVVDWMESFSSVWISAAPITVDTFFFLSGLLAVYTTIGKITRPRFIRSIHLFYINRLLRIFPLLAAVVLLQASLFNHVSDGPFWNNVAQATDHCRQWWWTALLHVQNYVNPLQTCLVQTWYLSVDIQLYIVCPLVLVWMFGHQLHAWIALTTALLLALVSSSLYSFLYNYSAALANLSRIAEFNEYVQVYYMNTLARAPPFFVGMVYGYILHLWRGKRVRVAKIHVAILWIMSLLMMALCIFSIYPVMQRDHKAQVFDNLMNAYMRGIWAVALGWLVLACVHGYGGPINWFLSLRMWKLPARLSFAMYLIHIPIIFIANASWVKTHYFSEGESIYRFASDLLLTSIAAFALCVLIDAPCSVLQKLLLGGGAKKRPLEKKTESREQIVDAYNDKYLKTSL